MTKPTQAATDVAEAPPVPPGGGSWRWDGRARKHVRDDGVPQTTEGDLAPPLRPDDGAPTQEPKA